MRATRRLLLPASAAALGVTGGVAVYYHSRSTPRPLSLVHGRWTGAGNIAGAVLLGFHFLHDPNGAGAPLLIGVPMWFPTTLSLAALLVAVRVHRRRNAPRGFDLGAAGGPGRISGRSTVGDENRRAAAGRGGRFAVSQAQRFEDEE